MYLHVVLTWDVTVFNFFEKVNLMDQFRFNPKVFQLTQVFDFYL